VDGLNVASEVTLVQGNVIGLNAAGTAALGNVGYGITFGAVNGVVGGTSPADRNLISGNGGGIRLAGEGNQIQGNHVGTDRTGTWPGEHRSGHHR
jgi:hypothetical protein